MSFDIDPREHRERFLIRHKPTNTLFEVNTRAEQEHYLEQDCEDVTNSLIYEENFVKQMQE